MLEDHLRLYRSLRKNRVKYLLIDGVACGIYGSPRVTKDIDIVVEPTLQNTRRVHQALIDAKFGTAHLTTPEKIAQNEVSIFNDYIRLDILTKPRALDFDKVWKRRVVKHIKGVGINLASIDDIIICKQAVGRRIDKEDIKILRKLKRL